MEDRTWRSMLVLVLVIAACAQGTTDSTAPTTTAGSGSAGDATVRIGYGGAPADLNPAVGVLTEDYILYELIYDSPITIDFNNQFQPELATDWSLSDDGFTWTMNIREGVTFTDGTPLTAEDVAFSINMYKDTEAIYLSTYASNFETIEATSPTTVVLTTAAPIANFESNIAPLYVLPKAIWAGLDDPLAFTNDQMIGSGPFKLAEYQQDEFVRLEANPDYWKGPPKVAHVIFQTYSNPDARVQALLNGEVDMITEFPATAIATLRSASNVTVADGSDFGGRFADIIFDMIDPANCPRDDGGVCTGHPALRDLTVRRALAHAVDKQQLIDVVLLGLGDVGLGLVPITLSDWFANELRSKDYQFDLDLAASMLQDAGYIDTDSDGIRECPMPDCGPTGDLTFRLNYPTDNDEHPRVADMLSGWWKEIGVAVEIQGLDGDALTSICCPTFDYDVILWSWTGGPDPDLLDVLNCESIPSGYSESGFCDPKYDALQKAQLTETDPAARREMIVELQRMALDQVPYIIPWYYPKIEAFRNDRFTGWPDQFPVVSFEDPASLTVIQPVG